jgi:3-oxoacyl-[acyl-carrier protein] reductase
MEKFILKEKVGIVTGAGSGIGKAIAKKLAQEGCNLVANDINETSLNNVVNEIQSLGYRAIGVKADVANKTEVELLVKTTIQKYGKIDLLVNNAGIYPASPVTELKEEEWNRVIDVNLKGVFICSQEVVKYMIKQKSGAIVNIGSVDGKEPPGGNAHYSAAKAGVMNITKTFALELAKYGIRVNCVAPGWVATPNILANDRWKMIINKIPIGRLAKPEEIADGVLFLLSDSSSYITGEILDINGGLMMD